MKHQYHIQFAISGHGFGHIGQCAPIIQLLSRGNPEIKISVRSEAPQFKLRERLGETVELQTAELDVGMIQKDALSVDLEKSYQSYCEMHSNWNTRIEDEARHLKSQDIDLLVANIPYLSLAAAKLAGIPCIGFCSLNWAEIYAYYFGNKNQKILQEIIQAYDAADFFLCPEPSMCMPNIKKRIDVGPVAQNFIPPTPQTITKSGDKIVLVSWGGMDLPFSIENWPSLKGFHIILPDDQPIYNTDKTSTLSSLNLPYSDAVQICDLLVAKPGYGTFVEAAMFGKPIICLPRGNWPEADILVNWYKKKGGCTQTSIDEFLNGNFLLNYKGSALPPKSKIKASGNQEVVTAILNYLERL